MKNLKHVGLIFIMNIVGYFFNIQFEDEKFVRGISNFVPSTELKLRKFARLKYRKRNRFTLCLFCAVFMLVNLLLWCYLNIFKYQWIWHVRVLSEFMSYSFNIFPYPKYKKSVWSKIIRLIVHKLFYHVYRFNAFSIITENSRLWIDPVVLKK